MAERGLWDNVVLPPGNDVGVNGFWWEVGVRFTVTVEIACVKLKWYRPSTSGPTPPKLRLWRATDQELLAEVDSSGDPATVGWHEHELELPVLLEVSTGYIVTAQFPNFYQMAYKTAGNIPAPPSELSFNANPHCYSTQGTYGFPSLGNTNTPVFLIDAVVDAEAEAPEGEIELGVENALARWLDADDAPTLRPNSLPVLIYDYLQTMQGIINEVQAKVDSTEDVVTGILGPSGAVFTGLLDAYLDNLNTLITQTLTAVDDLRGTGDPTVADVLTAVNAIPTDVSGGLPAGPVSAANGWTLRETIPFVGKVKTDEPADAYLLIRTMWDSDRQVNVYEDVTYFFDRGWWAPQQGDIIEGYGTLAAQAHLLRVPTGRMSGVLIVQDDDFEGDLQVWDAPA